MTETKKDQDLPEDLETEELQQANLEENGEAGADLDEDQVIGGINTPANEPNEDIALSGDHMYSLDVATDGEFSTLSEESEVVMDEIDRYTDDEEVLQDFADRQLLNTGREELIERLVEHHSKTPRLAGGDIDARWEDADSSGEESVGSTVPTPDQDVVDELGDAFGINYETDEPLATADKLNSRDQNRFELSPASMENDPDDDEDEDLINDLDDDLGTDLDEDLSSVVEEEIEDDFDDEFAGEIEDELDNGFADDEEEEDLEDDDGNEYDLEDLDDDLDDLDEFYDEDLDDGED